MISFLVDSWKQATDISLMLLQNGAAWFLLAGALVLYGYTLLFRNLPMFITAIMMSVMTFYAGHLIGKQEGVKDTLAMVAANSAKAKQEAEKKILDLASSLDDIADKLEESQEQDLKNQQSQQALKDVITKLTTKNKEQSHAGKGEMAVVDDGTRCLSIPVPSDVVRNFREDEDGLRSGPTVPDGKGSGKGQ